MPHKNKEDRDKWYEGYKPRRQMLVRKQMQSNKIKCIEAKGSKCSMCGLDYDGTNGCVFQFHHTDPNEKEHTLGEYMSRKWEKIEKELAKTIMLCANCHFKLHSEEY